MKKLIAILLAICTLLLCFAACTEVPPADTSSKETVSAETESSTDEPKLEFLLENFLIILPKNTADAVKDEITILNEIISDACGTRLMSQYDDFKGLDGEIEYNEYEILIGRTNREESTSLAMDMRYLDYGYAIYDAKIAIIGNTDETLVEAIKLFAADLEANSSDVMAFLKSKASKKVEGEHEIDTLMLNSKPIQDFTIVYPANGTNDEEIMAKDLAAYLSELSGYMIKYGSDEDVAYTEGALEILIGTTNRNYKLPDDFEATESYIGFTDGQLQITGGNFAALYSAIEDFRAMFNKTPVNKTLKIAILVPIRNKTDDNVLKIMGYNILRFDMSGREQKVPTMIKKHDPDVFGINEGTAEWITILEKELPEYAWVGESIDGSSFPVSGEYNAIFYKKDKFTLIKTETLWLSNTPTVVGSKIPESNNVRTATIAVLKRNSDGKVFVHINAHLQHDSYDARGIQAEILMTLIDEYREYPMFLTGDMNDVMGSRALNAYTKNGFVDSSKIASEAKTGSTFHDYTDLNIVIDFCLVSKGNVKVLKYQVCNEKVLGDYASDHHPVYIEAVLL